MNPTMTSPLPAYAAERLSGLAISELIRLMAGDEDRVPRDVIDECARRGEEMVRALEELTGAQGFWGDGAVLGEWWLRLHAAMILGLMASERAGVLLVALMRGMERARDDNLEDWLSGYWPALFRNKPHAVVPPLRALAQDRGVDWYMRIGAIEAVLAFAEQRGAQALDAELDWAAAIASDEAEDWTLRLLVGSNLVDFPRERHRALLEGLAARQRAQDRSFSVEEVQDAFSGMRDTPHWERFEDPWRFYAPEAIARQQERWAKEDAEESANEPVEDFPFDEPPGPYTKAFPKIGRNDPCPCGSGKKYKRCCLASAQREPVENLAWRRLRRVLDEHQRDMLRFVTNVYGRVAIEEAWRYFVSDGEAAFDTESRHIPLFMPWFYHCWSPGAGESGVRDKTLHGVIPTAAYLRRKKRPDPLLREYLESCLASPFSAFEVLRADPGRGLLMKDLFTGAQHEVTERSASAFMRTGDLIFGQVAKAGGVALLEAAQGFVIPPIWKIKVIELRQRHFASAIAVAPERLRGAEDALLVLYGDIATQLFERKLPVMQNTDGEALSLRRVVFDVPSAQEAFDALKHLALADSDAELFADSARDAGGALARVKLGWLKKGNAQMPAWENTVLGSIEIDGTRLTAEVNSQERESRLRAIVAEALSGRARYRATEIQSLERMLAEAPARAAGTNESEKLAELPEVKAKIAEMMARHYEHWVNENIPALGGRTPLEAVNDSAGREAVEALVAQIERDGVRMKPPLDPDIPRRLRDRLGLR
jgi:SEC-C motif/Protein of unknown function (DUF2384)